MWQWLVPLLRTCMQNITSETVSNWGSCIATMFDSRDARRLAPLIQLLFECAQQDCDTSFHQSV